VVSSLNLLTQLVVLQGYAVVGEQGVQQRTEDTPLGGDWVKSQCGGGVVANPHNLWSVCQEVQDPVAEGGVQNQLETTHTNGLTQGFLRVFPPQATGQHS
jgi:hypothetical protein